MGIGHYLAKKKNWLQKVLAPTFWLQKKLAILSYMSSKKCVLEGFWLYFGGPGRRFWRIWGRLFRDFQTFSSVFGRLRTFLDVFS